MRLTILHFVHIFFTELLTFIVVASYPARAVFLNTSLYLKSSPTFLSNDASLADGSAPVRSMELAKSPLTPISKYVSAPSHYSKTRPLVLNQPTYLDL